VKGINGSIRCKGKLNRNKSERKKLFFILFNFFYEKVEEIKYVPNKILK